MTQFRSRHLCVVPSAAGIGAITTLGSVMLTYVIVIGIVAVLLVAAAVLLCLLYVRFQREKLNKHFIANDQVKDGVRAFENVFGKGGGMAFVLAEAATHRPVYISHNIVNILGVTSEELISDPESYKRIIEKQYVREFANTFGDWERVGTGEYKYEFGYGDGKVATVEAFRAESFGHKYIAMIFSDCTEWRDTVSKMRDELDTALGQAAAKSTFLSSMSHEIRTPMNGVMGMMALARMNINDPEKVLGYLERAGELSVFLLGMINDILDISKIESGKMQLFNTTLDVFAFAEKIKNMFNGTITSKGIDFKVEAVDFTARYLVCDELRLTQVVTNLVSNASKFTPAGGKVEVTIKQLDRIGECIQTMIRVRDTGKGIAPENIRKIMRPFEQEEASTSHKYGGTGLGLAICDNIVKMMGGNIVIDSTLGKGTDFSVYLSLPVADVKQDMEQPVAQTAHIEKNDGADFAFDGCRILLAEDNEVNAEIAVEILESEGAIVTRVADGREAVEEFEKREPDSFDVLLLDIQMPRLDGRQAAREIRNSKIRPDGATVPIIALSADAFVEDVKLSEAAGMDGHVSKPIDFDELRKRVGEIIAAKKSGVPEKK